MQMDYSKQKFGGRNPARVQTWVFPCLFIFNVGPKTPLTHAAAQPGDKIGLHTCVYGRAWLGQGHGVGGEIPAVVHPHW